jgi:DNA repair protein RecN (Recombination protein N)
MINWLDVRNFVVIKQVQMTFECGLTVVTGETGAGKSVLVDALAVLLGDRASGDIVRSGSKRCEIQAGFDVSNLPDAGEWLATMDMVDDENHCTLRRVIYPDKASRGFINGQPVPIQSLREIGAFLADIHGQHEHHLLLKKQVQRELLDTTGGLADQVQALGRRASDLQSVAAMLSEAQSKAHEHHQHEAFLRHQVQELTQLDPDPDELAKITEKHARLAHTRELGEGAWQLLQELEEAEELSVSITLARAATRLKELSAFDPRLAPLAEQTDNLGVQLAETVADLKRFHDGYELDPGELEQIDQRLAALHDAARKYQVAPQDLKAQLETLSQDLAELDLGRNNPQALEQQLAELKTDYDKRATAISKTRRQTAVNLASAVNKQLPALGLESAVFSVTLHDEPAGKRGQHGNESVQFELQAAPDLAVASLERAASGGELSRISLAIQLAVAEDSSAPSCIYDEVDIGIGGRVAEIVGQKLRSLGENRQVLCITHLPQVAAQGHHHLKVTRLSGDETEVELSKLDEASRSEELARMLGGVEITAKTRAHAQELLFRAGV